ncbi:MAG: ketoacyl-ACP synthase III [Planctomycetota bacterium]|nr:ketoacyl-ACP synthase III [Planctomycetota bacterium]
MSESKKQGGPGAIGVRIAGVGSAVPPKVLSNKDLETMVETSDEWIVKRTGIHERRIVDPETEGTLTLSIEALTNALEHASMEASKLDLVILASVTSEMTCPSTACRVVHALGASPTPAFDLVAACSGFVYSINIADSLIRSGQYKNIGVIGCDTLSTHIDYTERSVSILFGDGAGAAVLSADEDTSLGCLYQSMYSEGGMWKSLYMPRRETDVPEGDEEYPARLDCLRMKGREVYKFAVGRFQNVIEEALEGAGLEAADIDQYLVHQSNIRMIDSAKQRLNLPDEKVFVNIHKYGNTSGGSVGICLDEAWKAGRIKPGNTIMMVAFGGGMTWCANVWKV